MISLDLKRPGVPQVLGTYSFRFDEHLVPALRENTESLVDGWLSWDDRNAVGPFTDELTRRFALLDAAREAGARWVVTLDPDERFERAVANRARELMDSGSNVISFHLREMYTPTKYRTDGIWDSKRQARLLDVSAPLVRPEVAEGTLHVPWTAYIHEPRVLASKYNVYHLKPIAPSRRLARARLYSMLDPEHTMQSIGYDYLADERDMALRRVAPWRKYSPKHVDDGGVWMDPHILGGDWLVE